MRREGREASGENAVHRTGHVKVTVFMFEVVTAGDVCGAACRTEEFGGCLLVVVGRSD